MQTFTFIFGKLEEKILEGQEYLGGPPAPLLLGLVNALTASPNNIVQLFLPKILSLMISSVALLMQEPLTVPLAVMGALQILKQALQDRTGNGGSQSNSSILSFSPKLKISQPMMTSILGLCFATL